MPFDSRLKSRKTTTLPAALRDELGLPAPSAQRRPFRPHDRGNRFDSHNGSGKPQLKAIGRPQSAVNGAAKGTSRGPIKSLRNQEKEQQEQQQQRKQQRSQAGPSLQHKGNKPTTNRNANANAASSSRANSNAGQADKKRKSTNQPREELKVIKKPKSTKAPLPQSEDEESVEQKQRLNPFTGELEVVKPNKKRTSSTKPTALEKMLARAEAGPSTSSNGKAKASEGLDGGKKKGRRHMTQQEKEDEDEIRWLEYSLGKSRQGEDVVRDDLDDFLDDLDRFQVGMYDESDSDEEEEESDDESDDSGLEDVSASEDDESEEGEEEEGDSEMDGESASEDEEMEALEGEGAYDFDSNDEDDFSNWDAAMATTDEEAEEDDDEEASTDEDDESEETAEEDSEAEEARALIAGSAKTASSDTVASTSASSAPAAATATKYIPPALRAKLAAESSSTTTPATSNAPSGPGITEAEMDPIAAQKLRRQAQGLLNRLGDGNIDTILGEYENLYRSHPRAHVTSTITQLIIDIITSRSNLIDTFVILHAALVAALHKVIGVEFAAYFTQRLVEVLTKHYDELRQNAGVEVDDEEDKGKECLNLTVLACELYNLHVVACPLIYDLIRMFLGERTSSADVGSITEVDIELLLRTIRCCGHQLRSDDSTSLKAIITLTQSRVATSTASTRTKFMLERMTDLQKNARSKSNANDASNPASATGQLLTRMKKFLGGLGKKRTVKAYEALRIGLKDLQDADKKGKWWLVGAAWTGQSDQSDAQGLTKLTPMNARSSAIQSSNITQEHDKAQQELLDLARSQGMNTDARRSVFITLITATDFRQAAENLLLLKLNDVQRREVIRVLVHCVGSESTYNPYYTLIGQEICRNDHGMRVTLQYCLWDFLRELGQSDVGGEKFAAAHFGDASADKTVDPRRVGNLARAYAWWMTHDCLSLQSLKTVDFTMMRTRPGEFLGLLMVHLVLSVQAKSPARTLHLPTVTKELKVEKLGKWIQANLLGGSADLSRGLLFFLNTKLDARAQRKLILGEESGDKGLRRQMAPLLEIVKEGLGVMLKTVEGIVQQQDVVGDGLDPLDGDSSDEDVDDEEE
ncbi:Initiation factor eIF-4 gamma, MA3 [Kalmanozyma brasiliensis GHG001]|uniref:MI domain-containing protein n=1 Tax=Kalmanozyma brasiliensis (strain GHG001) TaxID=1365824 RepID=V5GRT1_KALBG|nr:Initiation factor eIF-4 gamma, MA3 [Kalmanozyma brasiliensis GHG001]EST08622.1 Initiation factor eIF-4 gamma, MA3 [Kalmanozyma brasiliensis GHG001]